MDSQISLFDAEKEQAQRSRMDDMFLKWNRAPAEKVIHENDDDRPLVVAMIRRGFGLVWNQARHHCPALPPRKYIWLNEIELPEYWVLNDEGDPCGEHIEVCPFCGADLKHGKGDVIMQKAASARQEELLNNCLDYITEVVPRGDVARTLRKSICLTDDEIRQYEMGWAIAEESEGAGHE